MRSEVTFDLAARKERIRALGARRLEPGYWDDSAAASRTEKEIAGEKAWVTDYSVLEGLSEDIATLLELAEERRRRPGRRDTGGGCAAPGRCRQAGAAQHAFRGG